MKNKAILSGGLGLATLVPGTARGQMRVDDLPRSATFETFNATYSQFENISSDAMILFPEGQFTNAAPLVRKRDENNYPVYMAFPGTVFRRGNKYFINTDFLMDELYNAAHAIDTDSILKQYTITDLFMWASTRGKFITVNIMTRHVADNVGPNGKSLLSFVYDYEMRRVIAHVPGQINGNDAPDGHNNAYFEFPTTQDDPDLMSVSLVVDGKYYGFISIVFDKSGNYVGYGTRTDGQNGTKLHDSHGGILSEAVAMNFIGKNIIPTYIVPSDKIIPDTNEFITRKSPNYNAR